MVGFKRARNKVERTKQLWDRSGNPYMYWVDYKIVLQPDLAGRVRVTAIPKALGAPYGRT